MIEPVPRRPEALRRRGLRAAQRLAADLGLGSVEPEVLSDRGSLMLRLTGTGVVARVSTHTGLQRRRPGWWLAREVAVGRLAVAAGVPVVPPAEVDPGPHEVDGLWVTLWADVGTDPARATPQEAAAALALWHERLADAGPDLPVMPIVHELITDPLDHAAAQGFLSGDERAALAREHEEALAGVAGLGTREVLLHGDAHRGNLLRDPAGVWRWTDLEESCRGPVEWDLAVLGSQPTPEFGEAALAAYARLTGQSVPTPAELAPWRRLRRLEGYAWAIGCAVALPGGYAASAREYVAEVAGLAARAGTDGIPDHTRWPGSEARGPSGRGC